MVKIVMRYQIKHTKKNAQNRKGISLMNKVILMGRLTRDPDIRSSAGEESLLIARYTLAVDRRTKQNNNEQTADFIS